MIIGGKAIGKKNQQQQQQQKKQRRSFRCERHRRNPLNRENNHIRKKQKRTFSSQEMPGRVELKANCRSCEDMK